ncbi:hypothetical protein [Streptomyces ureilyticus]|uniref:hypothetical protein n=1 Tax=Streptomyces ureilyticus TaxID=1775131 RepID=UPI001F2476DD|nr:hypothetical protein [Streptomyces ureilyticus]
MTDLTSAGVQATRDFLIELGKGVLGEGIDDQEPLLAPALAQAAKNLVDGASPTPTSPPRPWPANSTSQYGRCTGRSPRPRSRSARTSAAAAGTGQA